jgi:hypothetical protein
MFVVTALQTIVHTQFVAMFMICLYAKFHTANCNGSLVIVIKPTVRGAYGYRCHAVSLTPQKFVWIAMFLLSMVEN